LHKRIQQLPSWSWAGWEGKASTGAIPVKWGKTFHISVVRLQESSIAAKTTSQIWNSGGEGTVKTSYSPMILLDGPSLEHLEMAQIPKSLDCLAPFFVLNQPDVLENVDFGDGFRSAICERFRELISSIDEYLVLI
jgi:hypothetical protein